MEEQQNKNDEPHLRRSLGLFDATMVVAGSMIGSGIFIVSADMSRTVGSTGWLLFLWLLSGLITVLAALSYGELAGMMPKAGGQFVYIQRACGNLVSFLYGWTLFTVIQTGTIAAVAVAFAKFTAVFFPVLSPSNVLMEFGIVKINAAQPFAIASILLLTYINSQGIRNGKFIQTLFTSAKLIALFALILLGLSIGLKGNTLADNFTNIWEATKMHKSEWGWEPERTPISGVALILALGTAIIGSLFSSDAWNNVTFIAGEIKEPKRNIPRSLFMGTAIVTVLYFLANIAYLSLLPLKGDPNATTIIGQGIQFATNDRVGTAAASMIFGNTAVYLMAALIMVSTFGCNNGLILSGARVYYAMAKEGLFFKRAETLNNKDVPNFALWIQAAWASVLCLSGTYSDLITYAIFAALIFYVVTIGGVFILRSREPNAERPYKTWAYPVTPALYILIAVAICVTLLIADPYNSWRGLAIVALGIPFYFIAKRKPS